jgi:hypothetical protein
MQLKIIILHKFCDIPTEELKADSNTNIHAIKSFFPENGGALS